MLYSRRYTFRCALLLFLIVRPLRKSITINTDKFICIFPCLLYPWCVRGAASYITYHCWRLCDTGFFGLLLIHYADAQHAQRNAFIVSVVKHLCDMKLFITTPSNENKSTQKHNMHTIVPLTKTLLLSTVLQLKTLTQLELFWGELKCFNAISPKHHPTLDTTNRSSINDKKQLAIDQTKLDGISTTAPAVSHK